MTSSFEVRFTEYAEHDIRDILQYSLEKWGPSQRSEYRASLDHASSQLSQFPYSGPVIGERFPNRRIRAVREHVIIYKVEGSIVTILRVVHKRRDISSLLIE